MNYISQNIKYLRLKNNLKQEDIAKIVKKNRTLVSLWEANEREITISDIIALSDYFNVPLEDFVGRDLRKQNNLQKAMFEKDGMKITIGKDGEITNDDFDEAMAFLLEQKIINKKDKK